MHCKANTKGGNQCTRDCKKGSKYCWQHQQKRSTQQSPKNEELQKKYCSCISSVKRKSPGYNAFAICSKTVGRVSKSCKQYEK